MENQNKVLLYSNLAIQMGAIIGIGTYSGNYLDESYNNQTPWWTIILSLSAVFLAFYQILKTLKMDDQ